MIKKQDVKNLEEFEDWKEFRSYYMRLGAFYGYILGSSLTFILCYLIFK